MADQDLNAYLAQHPVFKGLGREQLDKITQHASVANYSSQQRISKQDTTADRFYIVREGKVAVEVPSIGGEPLTIQTLTNDAVLGWSWLIPPYRWMFDSRALAPSSIVVLDGVKLRELCEADPKLGYTLLKHFAVLMAERMNAARLAAIEHYTGE